jgi:hypothetical protein
MFLKITLKEVCNEKDGVRNVAYDKYCSQTVAIDVLSLNFAIVFSFMYFLFR